MTAIRTPADGSTACDMLSRHGLVSITRQRRRHVLVFRVDGLAWTRDAHERHTTSVRGFNVIVWRAGELGYALVSDVDARDCSTHR